MHRFEDINIRCNNPPTARNLVKCIIEYKKQTDQDNKDEHAILEIINNYNI